MKSSICRNIIESPKICEAIKAFLNINKTPLTANNLCSFLQTKIWITVQARILRKILKGMLEMKFKKEISRLMSFDEERDTLIKQWFTIKLWIVWKDLKY